MEFILVCFNDFDDVVILSEVLVDMIGKRFYVIDEVFIGFCMMNIGYFRVFGEIVKNVLFS